MVKTVTAIQSRDILTGEVVLPNYLTYGIARQFPTIELKFGVGNFLKDCKFKVGDIVNINDVVTKDAYIHHVSLEVIETGVDLVIFRGLVYSVTRIQKAPRKKTYSFKVSVKPDFNNVS
jgi:hypothetical protein